MGMGSHLKQKTADEYFDTIWLISGFRNKGFVKEVNAWMITRSAIETGPKYTVLPEERRQRLWKSSNTSLLGWWIDAMTVLPSRRASLTMRLMTWYEAALSSPLVGSSRKRSLGRVKISMQMLTLLFWPPLRPFTLHPPILVSIEPCKPISLIVVSALSFFSDLGIESGSWSCAEKYTASLTVRVVMRVSSWVT